MGEIKRQDGLVFRNLHRFNLALLSKQCWKLVQGPLSLASQVFKHKYFSHSDFMKVKVGSHPFFVWRSLLVGQELLKAGLV